VPLLAASHEVSVDGLLNRITLRQGVTFHNGEEMQAADVIASVERWGKISGLAESLLEATEEIVEVDPHTIEFHMNAPFGTFAMALSRQLQGCAIYPKSVLGASTDTSLAEYIGTGPYRLVEWKPDQHVLMERYDSYVSPKGEPDGYAGRKEQHLDKIEFVPVPNEASRMAGLRAGDYAFVETVSPDQVPALTGSDRLVVETLPADSWLNIVLNLRSPVLADVSVRRAIQTALDHNAIMLAAYGEGFYELTPELVPGAPTWYSDAGSEYFNQNDPDEARRLLDESGYDSAPLRIMTTQEVQQEYNATVTMKQQLEAAGFTVDLQVYDGATLSDRRDDETAWEMYTASASFRPDPVMRNLTKKATGWWVNDEKDRLLAELQTESDYDKRFALWEQVQAMFYEDVPRLKIGNMLRVLVRSNRLQNIGPTEMQPEFSNAWLE
jgi:peptide/nickel transport system substrate-binding protein